MRLLNRTGLFALVMLASAVFPGRSARAELRGDVETILQDKLLRKASVGIEMIRLGQSPGQDRELLNLDAHTPRIPASNLKLATTSAALDTFGSNFNFQTQLLLHSGDLVLIGDGDPTMGDAEFLKKAGWDVNTLFADWAQQMRQKLNLTTVKDVVIDDSVFDTQFIDPHWPANQFLKRYCAEVGGLDLNVNCADFYISAGAPGSIVSFKIDPPTQYLTVTNDCRSGDDNAIWLARDWGSNKVTLRGKAKGTNLVPVSLTVNDPSMYTGTVLAETLAANGIAVTGNVRRDRTAHVARAAAGTGDKWLLLGLHRTPISSVLARANKDSVDLYAECLCKRLGFAASGASGSWANGTAAVAAFLQKTGAKQTEFSLDDGCGLSKFNRISPATLAGVLRYDFYSPNHATFAASLAVAGVDGTLDDRFAGTDLRGRVFAKSGTVDGVSALSGYLHAKDDGWYVFSIMMNDCPPGSAGGCRALQDRIVRALDLNTAYIAARR
jgi:D-alanyl-D-alanine carboxypeptidase/D-alanyl-D-alanine-endopeptidase (penicillin-binding protein 4)